MLKFDVLIPVFNTPPAHLMEAVDSIKNQTLKANQIILVDDGSTSQATLAVLKALEKTCKIVTLEVNQGTAVALNIGHGHCECEWIAIMGSDDICDPQRFALQAEYINAHPETDVIGTNLYSFYDNDPKRSRIYHTQHAEKPPLRPSGNVYWLVNHGTVMYRKSKVLAVGGYTPALRRAQDVDLWSKLYKAGAVFRNITAVLYGWRKKAA